MRSDLYFQLLDGEGFIGRGEEDESVRVTSAVAPAFSASAFRRSVFLMVVGGFLRMVSGQPAQQR